MLFDEAGPLLSSVVTKLPDLWRSGKSDSLSEYVRPARNDFITLVEDNLIELPFIPDLMQNLLTLTAGYYLTAANLAGDVNSVAVLRTLDKLNTKRDPIESVLGTGSSIYKFVGTESFAHGLPSAKSGNQLTAFSMAPSKQQYMAGLESNRGGVTNTYQNGSIHETNTNINNTGQNHTHQHTHAGNTNTHTHTHAGNTTSVTNFNVGGGGSGGSRSQPSGTELGKDTVRDIQQLANLSVGKLIELKFTFNGNTTTLTTQVRLAVTNTDSESVRAILGAGSINNTFKERWYRMRAGELSCVADLIFCNDLIEESRRVRLRDKSGFYAHMMRKRSGNWLSGLLSLNPSINNASAILVVSEETAKQAELELGGKLSNFATRANVFKNTSAFLLAVVDRSWEQVTIYHRGIDTSTTLTARELKRGTKSSGADVEDILRAYTAGTAPTL